MANKKRKEQGFSLLEVLVSILVFALGMLGLAALQMSALNYNSNSYLRTIAILKAEDMAERMRANMTAVADGNYHVPTATGTENLNCLGKTGGGADDTGASCTSAQMALHDVFEWKADVTGSLPSAAGIVCLDSTPDDGTPDAVACDGSSTALYVIKIWWNERVNNVTENNANEQQFLNVTFQP